jgi:hypothetical protein
MHVLRPLRALCKAGVEKRPRSLAPAPRLYKRCLKSPPERQIAGVGSSAIIHNFCG